MSINILKKSLSLITAIAIMASCMVTVNAATLLDYFKTDDNLEAINEDIRVKADFAGFDEYSGNVIFENKGTATFDRNTQRIYPRVEEGFLGLLAFTAVSDNGAGAIKVVCGTYGNITYDIPVQNTRYYIPFNGNKGDISIEGVKGNVAVSDLVIATFDATTYSINELKKGAWLCDNFTKIDLSAKDSVGALKGTTTCFADEKYIYTAQDGTLTIFEIGADGTETQISVLKGVYDARHMMLANNGKTLVIPSRGYGVFFVDVENPYEPFVANVLDSLELVSSAYIEGDYIYLCSRYFGIEIYNISDIYNPVFCALIRDGKENQNCIVDNGILYVALYNESYIKTYDVTDPYNPSFIEEIKAPGKVYGLDVKDGYLYATIANTNGSNAMESALMNGFAVYKAEKGSMELVTTVRIDGAASMERLDVYNLDVHGNYLYMSHTYNGLYIYDISNPVAPKRIEQIRVPIYKYDTAFKTGSSTTNVYPFNRNYMFPDPVTEFSVHNGTIYLSGIYTGLYKVSFKDAIQVKEIGTTVYNPTASKAVSKTVQLQGYVTDNYYTDAMVYAAEKYDGKYYVACSSDGIHVLDENLMLIEKIQFSGIVKDLKIRNGKLFVAASDGIYVYDVNNTENYILFQTYRNTSSLQVSDDGRFVVAQGVGVVLLEFVDDKENNGKAKFNIHKTGYVSNLYYRNLINGFVDGRYSGVLTSSTTEIFDVNTDVPGKITTAFNPKISELYGAVAYKDKCIVLRNGGYHVCDVNTESFDVNSLPFYKIDGEKLTGKASVIGNELFVIKEYTGEIWRIDISDVTKPVLIEKITTTGSPDLFSGDSEEILIPLKHEGLARLKKQ